MCKSFLVFARTEIDQLQSVITSVWSHDMADVAP